jgi:MFS family permease
LDSNYKWYVVGMLWLICFLNYADRVSVFSLFPLLQRELRLTPVQLGLLGSAFAWAYGLMAPVGGNVADAIRRKLVILGGLYVWSAIAVATSLAHGFRQLFCFMGAEGLGETFYQPASMSLISDYHGADTRSRAMGFHQTSVYVGTVAGGFFAGLIGERYGWRSSFVFFGALGIGLGFVLTRYIHEPLRGADGQGLSARGLVPELPGRIRIRDYLKMARSTPTALLLMGAFICANFVALVLLSWMPEYLYSKFKLSLAMAGLSATVFAQVASMVGSPLGGWLADLLRRRTPGGRMMVQAGAVLCGAPFVVLCGWTHRVGWALVALTAWGLCKGVYDSNIFASLYDVTPPEARGTAAGFMNMVGWLGGGGLAPVLIGYFSQRAGLGFAISCSAAVYVTAGLLLIIGIMWYIRGDASRIEKELARSNPLLRST